MAGFTLFDLIVLAIVVFSALFAFARGLIREALTIVSWIGAIAVAWLGFPFLQPLVREAIGHPQLSDAAALLGGFLVPLIVFKTLAGMIGRAVDSSPIGFVDKLGGLLFGVARGALVVCALYLVGSFAVPQVAQLTWVADAKLVGPVRQGAELLASFLPADLGGAVREAGDKASRAADVIRDPASALAPPEPKASDGSAAGSYDSTDRTALDALVDRNSTP